MTEFADPADVAEPTLEMEFVFELDEPLEPKTDGASLPLRNRSVYICCFRASFLAARSMSSMGAASSSDALDSHLFMARLS